MCLLKNKKACERFNLDYFLNIVIVINSICININNIIDVVIFLMVISSSCGI